MSKKKKNVYSYYVLFEVLCFVYCFFKFNRKAKMYRDFDLAKAESQRSLYLCKNCVQVVLLCQFYLT